MVAVVRKCNSVLFVPYSSVDVRCWYHANFSLIYFLQPSPSRSSGSGGGGLTLDLARWLGLAALLLIIRPPLHNVIMRIDVRIL